MKICNICKIELSFDSFHKSKEHRGGVDSRCKNCSSIYHQKQYQNNILVERQKRKERMRRVRINNPDYTKNSHLKERYGITLQQKLELLNKQNGRCAICKKDIIKIKACVDHDHKTGKIRGLLCDKCNRALGGFEDNKEYLQQAMEYLDKNTLV